MSNSFINKSKNLLLNFLSEPGGFSFFPSSFFWKKNFIKNNELKKIYIKYFNSEFYNIDNKNNKLNLYIHIPFCTKICSYCNCFKKKLNEKKEIDNYIDYLEKEINLISELNNNKKIKINTIFIGGGTPNLLNITQFFKLYSIIEKYFSLDHLEQFLVDGHPNYYSKEKLDCLYNIGVNRVTFAIQSFDEKVLKLNNRDIYNLNLLKNNIKFAKSIGLKINIDLLIGLKGQTFKLVKRDIDIINKLDIDNVSVHYLMNSNNIDYYLDDNYLDLIKNVKKYLLNNRIKNNSSNITEDYYASKRNSTLSIGATAVTNIYSNITYIKPEINKYFEMLNNNLLPIIKGSFVSSKDEMIKYIYLNILYGIRILEFKKIFGEDIFQIFHKEFIFLRKNNIFKIENNTIISNKTDLETLIYFNVFFLKNFSNLELNNYTTNNSLTSFFLEGGELIDK